MRIVYICMQLLVYSLTYPLLWLISRLPNGLFYGFSDLGFFLTYRVFGYRKKVVYENLKLVFPQKDEAELKRIRKKFYSHMCDMFLEMVKTMSIGEKELKLRYNLQNPELLQKIEKERSVFVLFPHYANWEWSIITNRFVSSKGYAIYQNIGNVYFDRLIKRIRAKWNTTPITQKETARTIVRNESENQRGVYGIVSDQSPQAHRAQYWAPFMGIKVPVFNGPETLARKFDLAVLFAKVSKLRRGYYSIEFIPICENGKQTEKNEITDAFLKLTEEQINTRPEYYLWTHKRWKHRNKTPRSFAEVKP